MFEALRKKTHCLDCRLIDGDVRLIRHLRNYFLVGTCREADVLNSFSLSVDLTTIGRSLGSVLFDCFDILLPSQCLRFSLRICWILNGRTISLVLGDVTLRFQCRQA